LNGIIAMFDNIDNISPEYARIRDDFNVIFDYSNATKCHDQDDFKYWTGYELIENNWFNYYTMTKLSPAWQHYIGIKKQS
jgi:hypothetical protein